MGYRSVSGLFLLHDLLSSALGRGVLMRANSYEERPYHACLTLRARGR